MPRPNPPRSLVEEANLVRRLAHEREARGWSYDGLAKRMTEAGCPINQSALYKIEKGDPPRRITVAELVALGEVFAMPIAELLLPPDVASSRRAAELVERYRDARSQAADLIRQAREVTDAAEADLAAFVRDEPDNASAVERYLASLFRGDSHWPADLVDMWKEAADGKHQEKA